VAAQLYDTLPAARYRDGGRLHGRDQGQGQGRGQDDGRAGVVLRFGYTLGEVHGLAMVAVVEKVPSGVDRDDAYEVAWFAIVEALYRAADDQRPIRGRLIWTAKTALGRHLRTERRHHGRPLVGPGDRLTRSFERYWGWHARLGASPEEGVVERLALGQVWARLREIDRRALGALAATGSHRASAELLGYASVRSFDNTIRLARHRALRLWFQGERPPAGMWRPDVPAGGGWVRHDHAICGCVGCGKVRARQAADPAADQASDPASGPAAGQGRATGRCA
jgi:hypothetical protein